MKIKLENSWIYQDDDWWEWSAYLTGDGLDRVVSVDYILHPTFTNPLKTIRARSTNFRLDTAGWGEFELKAVVHFDDDTRELLIHELKLRKRPPIGNTET